MPPTFQIHYFASASSYTGKHSESLPAPLPLQKLFDLLESRYPGMKEKVLASCAVTVGLEYVDVEEAVAGGPPNDGKGMIIQEGDEVGIIPPVSSG